MPRYLVERSFPDGLGVPPGSAGRRLLGNIVVGNADRQVTWVHSYVSSDDSKTYCIYDAPSPEAVRICARTVGLPVDRITEVSVLDPYAYHLGHGQG